MPPVLALDFDGVVADSAAEAFVVALRSFGSQRPGSALPSEVAPGLAGRAPSRAQVLAHPLYAPFLELMPLGNRAEDYGVVLAAIEARAAISDQAGYDAFRGGRSREELRAFHRAFYQVRAALAEVDPAGWTALMGPYPELLPILRRRSGEVMLAIATAKDRGSVASLLRSYGIDDLFPGERLLDKETGVSKADHMRHLHQQLGVAYAEITFIEDKVNHLDAVAPLGVRCVLAAWGYNGEREIRHARARGYLVCTLADVEERLFGAPRGASGGWLARAEGLPFLGEREE